MARYKFYIVLYCIVHYMASRYRDVNEKSHDPRLRRTVQDEIETKTFLNLSHFLLQPIMFTDIFFVVDFMFL